MIRTAATLIGAAVLVLAGISGPAVAVDRTVDSAGAGCTQQRWRTVATADAVDQSPFFREAEQSDDDETLRWFERAHPIRVRKLCGEFQVRVRPGNNGWRKLRTTTPVTSQSATDSPGDTGGPSGCDQEWRRVITRTHIDQTPAFTPDNAPEGDDGYHYFKRYEQVRVAKKCQDYRVRVRNVAGGWNEYTTDDTVDVTLTAGAHRTP